MIWAPIAKRTEAHFSGIVKKLQSYPMVPWSPVWKFRVFMTFSAWLTIIQRVLAIQPPSWLRFFGLDRNSPQNGPHSVFECFWPIPARIWLWNMDSCVSRLDFYEIKHKNPLDRSKFSNLNDFDTRSNPVKTRYIVCLRSPLFEVRLTWNLHIRMRLDERKVVEGSAASNAHFLDFYDAL